MKQNMDEELKKWSSWIVRVRRKATDENGARMIPEKRDSPLSQDINLLLHQHKGWEAV